MFSAVLKSKEILTFGGRCNRVDYSDSEMCTFREDCDISEGNHFTTLAMIPYSSIDYIINSDCMADDSDCGGDNACERCIHQLLPEDGIDLTRSYCYMCKRNPKDNRIDWFYEKTNT